MACELYFLRRGKKKISYFFTFDVLPRALKSLTITNYDGQTHRCHQDEGKGSSLLETREVYNLIKKERG